MYMYLGIHYTGRHVYIRICTYTTLYHHSNHYQTRDAFTHTHTHTLYTVHGAHAIFMLTERAMGPTGNEAS